MAIRYTALTYGAQTVRVMSLRASYAYGEKRVTLSGTGAEVPTNYGGVNYKYVPRYSGTLAEGRAVSNYSISDSSTSAGLALGTVESAAFTLTVEAETALAAVPDPLDLVGAMITVQIGLQNAAGAIVWSPFGVWKVSEVSMPAGSAFLTLSGNDLLNTALEGVGLKPRPGYYNPRASWIDANSADSMAGGAVVPLGTDGELLYRYAEYIAYCCNIPVNTNEGIAWHGNALGGYVGNWSAKQAFYTSFFPDGTDVYSTEVEFDEATGDYIYGSEVYSRTLVNDTTTARDLLSQLCTVLGCFAQIAWDGSLCLCGRKFEKHYRITPDSYTQHERAVRPAMDITAVGVTRSESIFRKTDKTFEIVYRGDTISQFCYDEALTTRSAARDQYNTVNIDCGQHYITEVHLLPDMLLGNKLIVNPDCNAVRAGSVTWVGDPAVRCGAVVHVIGADDSDYTMLINRATFDYDGSLSSTLVCELPAITDTIDDLKSAAASSGNILVANSTEGKPKPERVPLHRTLSATDETAGTITASSVNGGSYTAYRAMDNSGSTSWASRTAPSTASPQMITYKLPDPASGIIVEVIARDRTPIANPLAGYLQGSADGSTWTTLATFSGWSTTARGYSLGEIVSTDIETEYRYIRLCVTSSSYSSYVAIGEIRVAGYVGSSSGGSGGSGGSAADLFETPADSAFLTFSGVSWSTVSKPTEYKATINYADVNASMTIKASGAFSDSYAAKYAADTSTGDAWASPSGKQPAAGSIEPYIEYGFTDTTSEDGMHAAWLKLWARSSSSNNAYPITGYIRGLNSSGTWDDLATFDFSEWTYSAGGLIGDGAVPLFNSSATKAAYYKRFRIYFTKAYGSSGYVAVGRIALYYETADELILEPDD